MSFSFLRLLISESDSHTCREAFNLINKKQVKVERTGTASCKGKIDGCEIRLGFSRIGVPSWKCSCDKIDLWKSEKPCIHVVVAALAWDRSRDIPDPSKEDIEYLTSGR